MRLNESFIDGTAIFSLEGDLDFHDAPVLRTLLRSKIRMHCRALVIDLSDVLWIDSTGIAILIEYLRDTAKYGGTLCLAGANETLRSIFEVVRLNTLAPMFDSVEEAMAALRAGTVKSPGIAAFPEAAA